MSGGSDDNLPASLDGKAARLDVVERLLAKRSVNPETGCWEWQGRRDRCGYGRITVAHRRYAVHRLSAAVFLGFDLVSPLQILHGCHNPACFNPEHLRPGTHQENTQDRRRRLAAQQR
ncbi:MAG: HNH endonuclease [Rhodospirillaceae bacterium]